MYVKLCVIFSSLVVDQEKTRHNIEAFDKNKLKHAETAEKNPLPDKAGRSSGLSHFSVTCRVKIPKSVVKSQSND